MNTRATILLLMTALAGCSASHSDRTAIATPQPGAATPQARALHGTNKRPNSGLAPIHAAYEAAISSPGAVVAPHSGASEAAKAAGAESRSSAIPKIRDVPAGGATTAGATNASDVESRSSTIPIVRDVPATRVTTIAGLPAGVPYASDKDPVQIVSYVLSSTIIHPGDKVTGDVVTSSNAASVTAQVGSITVAVPKIAPGKFHLLLQLPSMPLPPGAEKLIITAIRTDGVRTTREVPITVVL
jgi:hypothetical protein